MAPYILTIDALSQPTSHTPIWAIWSVLVGFLYNIKSNIWLNTPATPPPKTVIGHGIGGKYIPIMAHLAKARRWSKRWQTCLSSPNLTANHNEWWLEDPSTLRHVLRKDPTISYVENLTNHSNEYLGRTRVAGILKRISYEIHVSYVCK